MTTNRSNRSKNKKREIQTSPKHGPLILGLATGELDQNNYQEALDLIVATRLKTDSASIGEMLNPLLHAIAAATQAIVKSNGGDDLDYLRLMNECLDSAIEVNQQFAYDEYGVTLDVPDDVTNSPGGGDVLS